MPLPKIDMQKGLVSAMKDLVLRSVAQPKSDVLIVLAPISDEVASAVRAYARACKVRGVSVSKKKGLITIKKKTS